jgi:hypothetical protein
MNMILDKPNKELFELKNLVAINFSANKITSISK